MTDVSGPNFPVRPLKTYSEKEISRNPKTRLMERAAITGSDPTLAQIEGLSVGLPKLARFGFQNGRLFVRWYESLETCGATDWAPCEGYEAHVYGVCGLPKGHEGRFHREERDGRLWAEWSGDSGPVPFPRCIHTND